MVEKSLKTKYMIAEAGSDADAGDESTNNIRGEQRGYELRAIWDYEYEWVKVFRAKDEALREQIADFMERAVLNGYVGYAQQNRGTLFNNIKNMDFRVELLNSPANCDCSSLTYCAIYAATRIPFTEDVSIAPITDTFETYLNTTGLFDDITADDYLGKTDNLERGDILLEAGHHVAVYI